MSHYKCCVSLRHIEQQICVFCLSNHPASHIRIPPVQPPRDPQSQSTRHVESQAWDTFVMNAISSHSTPLLPSFPHCPPHRRDYMRDLKNANSRSTLFYYGLWLDVPHEYLTCFASTVSYHIKRSRVLCLLHFLWILRLYSSRCGAPGASFKVTAVDTHTHTLRNTQAGWFGKHNLSYDLHNRRRTSLHAMRREGEGCGVSKWVVVCRRLRTYPTWKGFIVTPCEDIQNFGRGGGVLCQEHRKPRAASCETLRAEWSSFFVFFVLAAIVICLRATPK